MKNISRTKIKKQGPKAIFLYLRTKADKFLHRLKMKTDIFIEMKKRSYKKYIIDKHAQ